MPYDWSLTEQREHRQAWIAAILNKKYSLINSSNLKTDKGYSVLGILELISGGGSSDQLFFNDDYFIQPNVRLKGHWINEWRSTRSESATAISLESMRWVGMNSSAGMFRTTDGKISSISKLCASLNDVRSVRRQMVRLIKDESPYLFHMGSQREFYKDEIVENEVENEVEDA